MKIIFLDIDGVLNSVDSFKKTRKEYPNNEICYDNPHPDHIQWLNKIVNPTDAKVAISSTWRSSFSSMAMWRFLSVCGFRGMVVGSTPKLDSYRGTEIKCWILEHTSGLVKYKDSNWKTWQEPIESFVILDDGSDMEDLISHLVKTDNNTGLLEEHADKAIKMLNKKHI